MPNNEFNFVKIKTHCLKVHMNCQCQGCLHRVRKLLKKIEGVYKVEINAEQQKVTVTGSVECTILIQKLRKCGKKAELWASSSKQDEVEEANLRENLDTQMHDFDTFKNQQTFPMFGREFNNGSGFEWYLNQGNSVSRGESEFNPISMGHNGAVQGYGVDTSGLRGLHFGGFPDFPSTQLMYDRSTIQDNEEQLSINILMEQ